MDWKATGRGMRFACVRTVTKCCKKRSRAALEPHGLHSLCRKSDSSRCTVSSHAVWYRGLRSRISWSAAGFHGPQLAAAHLLTRFNHSTQAPGFGLKDRRPGARFRQRTNPESTTYTSASWFCQNSCPEANAVHAAAEGQGRSTSRRPQTTQFYIYTHIFDWEGTKY